MFGQFLYLLVLVLQEPLFILVRPPTRFEGRMFLGDLESHLLHFGELSLETFNLLDQIIDRRLGCRKQFLVTMLAVPKDLLPEFLHHWHVLCPPLAVPWNFHA